jgi:hypothetical protein
MTALRSRWLPITAIFDGKIFLAEGLFGSMRHSKPMAVGVANHRSDSEQVFDIPTSIFYCGAALSALKDPA